MLGKKQMWMLGLCWGFAALCNTVWAQSEHEDEPMRIVVRKANPAKIAAGNEAHEVYLTGIIDAQAADRLTAVLKAEFSQEELQGLDFILNSRGGSLWGGIQIGAMIRMLNGSTIVGRLPDRSDYADTFAAIKPGVCLSACSLAFLGGLYRFYKDGSLFGIHQFYLSDEFEMDVDDSVAVTQLGAAMIQDYLTLTDVDVQMFLKMATTDKNDIRLLSQKEMEEMNVVNHGSLPPEWQLVTYGGIHQFYTHVQARGGNGFVSFACGEDGVLKSGFIYRISPAKLDGLSENHWLASLHFPDGGSLSLAHAEYSIHQTDDTPLYKLLIALEMDEETMQKILAQRSLELRVSPQGNAASSMGFTVALPEKARQELSTFVKMCENTQRLFARNEAHAKAEPQRQPSFEQDYEIPQNINEINASVRKYASGANAHLAQCMSYKLKIFNRRYYRKEPEAWSADMASIIDQAARGTVKTCQKEIDAASQGPSFDCAEAQLPTELTLCDVPALRQWDVMFNNAVHAARAMGDKDAVNRFARQWIKERNACGVDVQCITQAYSRGMTTLFERF